MTEEVVRVLRERILLGQYLVRLPAERTLCEELDASRACVRIALERLSTEGLIMPVASRRWQILNPGTDGGLELVTNGLSSLGHDAFVARVHELLDHRKEHFVAHVSLLIDEGIRPSDEAIRALDDMGLGIHRKYADVILENEDDAMAALVNSEATLPRQVGVHQVRRAMQKLRKLLKLDFYLRHNAVRFNVLFEAVDSGDREHALLFAKDVAGARDALYQQLAKEATEPGGPERARVIFGEN